MTYNTEQLYTVVRNPGNQEVKVFLSIRGVRAWYIPVYVGADLVSLRQESYPRYEGEACPVLERNLRYLGKQQRNKLFSVLCAYLPCNNFAQKSQTLNTP